MSRFELLVDSGAFAASLERDLAAAQHRVWLQTLSLEGDRVGRWLAAALHRCTAGDRRVLIDSFNRVVLSGRFMLDPATIADPHIQREAAATHVMLNRLNRRGAAVRYCAPLGRALRRLPARNHKKSILVDDDIAYIGGFNFSEHNFSWHDSMLCIRDAAVAAFLRDDFLRTWHHQPRVLQGEFDGIVMDVLDGRSNERVFGRLFESIRRARERIVVHSPYLMFPFVEHLAAAARRGVNVTIITPSSNTIPALSRYIRWKSRRHGFELHVYPGMTHLKALLIDDRLVLGSSNFDYLSYCRHQEIVASVTDPALVADFVRRVLGPDLALCAPAPSHAPSERMLEARMRLTGLTLAAVSW